LPTDLFESGACWIKWSCDSPLFYGLDSLDG
jgi:hypothetical protein